MNNWAIFSNNAWNEMACGLRRNWEKKKKKRVALIKLSVMNATLNALLSKTSILGMSCHTDPKDVQRIPYPQLEIEHFECDFFLFLFFSLLPFPLCCRTRLSFRFAAELISCLLFLGDIFESRRTKDLSTVSRDGLSISRLVILYQLLGSRAVKTRLFTGKRGADWRERCWRWRRKVGPSKGGAAAAAGNV